MLIPAQVAHAAPGVSKLALELNAENVPDGHAAFNFTVGEASDTTIGFTLADKQDLPAEVTTSSFRSGTVSQLWHSYASHQAQQGDRFTDATSTVRFSDTSALEKRTAQGVWKIVDNGKRLIFVPNDSVMNFRADRAQLAQRIDNISVVLTQGSETETLSVGVVDAPAFSDSSYPQSQTSRVFNPEFVRVASSPDEVLTWKLSEVFTSASSMFLAPHTRWQSLEYLGKYPIPSTVDEQNGVLVVEDIAGTWRIDEKADLISYTPAPGTQGSASNSFTFRGGDYTHSKLNVPILFAQYPAPSTKEVTVTKVTPDQVLTSAEGLEDYRPHMSSGEMYLVENIPHPAAFFSKDRPFSPATPEYMTQGNDKYNMHTASGSASGFARETPVDAGLYEKTTLPFFVGSPLFGAGEDRNYLQLSSVTWAKSSSEHALMMAGPLEQLTSEVQNNIKLDERYSVIVVVPPEESLSESERELLYGGTTPRFVQMSQAVGLGGNSADVFAIDSEDRQYAQELLNQITFYDNVVPLVPTPETTEPSTPVTEAPTEPSTAPVTKTTEPSTSATETPTEPSTAPVTPEETSTAPQDTPRTNMLANTGAPLTAVFALVAALVLAAGTAIVRRN